MHGNLQATLGQIDHADFDAICLLLAAKERHVYAMGGRITHVMADYFVTHMKVIRQNVTLISDMSNTWPPALMDIKPGDVLLVFDIRRYENAVLQVAEVAVEQGAEVVLITDQWISPPRRLHAIASARISRCCRLGTAPSRSWCWSKRCLPGCRA
ncbi:MAG: SIS domain-containing protein [Paracoccaceae bacterium]